MQPFETREDILTAARECFSRGATLRTRRERYKRFTFGAILWPTTQDGS